MTENIHTIFICMYIAVVTPPPTFVGPFHILILALFLTRFIFSHFIVPAAAAALMFAISFGPFCWPCGFFSLLLLLLLLMLFGSSSLLVFAMCMHTSSSNISFVARVCFLPLSVPPRVLYLFFMVVARLILFRLLFVFIILIKTELKNERDERERERREEKEKPTQLIQTMIKIPIHRSYHTLLSASSMLCFASLRFAVLCCAVCFSFLLWREMW